MAKLSCKIQYCVMLFVCCVEREFNARVNRMHSVMFVGVESFSFLCLFVSLMKC